MTGRRGTVGACALVAASLLIACRSEAPAQPVDGHYLAGLLEAAEVARGRIVDAKRQGRAVALDCETARQLFGPPLGRMRDPRAPALRSEFEQLCPARPWPRPGRRRPEAGPAPEPSTGPEPPSPSRQDEEA